jgi:hypothetical protein
MWCEQLRWSPVALVLATGAGSSFGQTFIYVDAGLASCPAAPAPATGAPKRIAIGVSAPGRINVSCGFDQGSYTVTLSSSDAAATFSPKTFLVNFGRVVGNGTFAVTFSTAGVQSVSASITSNMGSPAVLGHFASSANQFNVVSR